MRSKTWKTSAAVLGAAAALALTACGKAGSSGSAPTASASGSGAGTVASQLVLGGPAEFKTRVQGIPGLARVYGVRFGSFKTLDASGPLTINALKNGQVDAADIFTTDPSIKIDNFVVLQDPKNLYAAQNVVPLISKAKATPGVTATLNKVSAALTTNDLVALNKSVQVDKQSASAVAKAWLASKGLDATGSAAAGASLTVGSANFSENETLADIYAQALQAQGATVATKLNIGSRETYIPGLQDGSINLIPEYTGNLLLYFDKAATASSSSAVYAALTKALPPTLTVLSQSQAQDKDAIVVRQSTAQKYHLTSIADLAKKA